MIETTSGDELLGAKALFFFCHYAYFLLKVCGVTRNLLCLSVLLVKRLIKADPKEASTIFEIEGPKHSTING